jgi:hypothetical protein
MRIKIITENMGIIEALLTEENPKTVKAIWGALPIEAKINTWGDEIYFKIPVMVEKESPKELVEMGDIAYWPPGNAFCIFFGKTPLSRGNEIRPASAVNVFGKIIGDPKIFKNVEPGESIRLERSQ